MFPSGINLAQFAIGSGLFYDYEIPDATSEVPDTRRRHIGFVFALPAPSEPRSAPAAGNSQIRRDAARQNLYPPPFQTRI